MWRHNVKNTKGFIFVVDRDRVVEARDELHRMMNENELGYMQEAKNKP